ncbi:MAG: catalase [Rhodobacteraceae bacterium]|nr:catalase [Paracoccaceae bacterium]
MTGSFERVDDEILNYSSSPIFAEASTFLGRVSHKGGKSNAADDVFGDYGLAFEIKTTSGDTHIMKMNTEDFFPVPTAEEFVALMRAKAQGDEAVAAFAKNSPDLRAHKAHQSARDMTLRPYEGATYNSINSFYLVDNADTRTAVRWSFVPAGEHDIVLETSPSFFLEKIRENLSRGEVAWDMVVTIANPADDILNPATPWEGDHTQFTAARLVVENAMQEEDSTCGEMNFDPLVLSDGFEPTEDPMLEARSAVYAIGVSRRLSE